jgi:hypothetical protein
MEVIMKTMRRLMSRTFLVFGLFFFSTCSASAAGRVFYDGFESGNTDLWSQDGVRNRCTVVVSAADGIVGPAGGSKMVRCNSDDSVAWDAPAKFETLSKVMPTGGGMNELFIRIRLRLDTNHDRVYAGSIAKKLRFWPSPDLFLGVPDWDGLKFESPDYGVYWGDGSGDTTATSAAWHIIEYYWGGGQFKLWYDDVLRHTASASGTPANTLYLQSNWEDPHDTINYIYYDEIEFFTNIGTGATGSMSAGTITQGGGDTTAPAAPTGLGVN